MVSKDDVDRYLDNIQEEVDAAHLYRLVAEREANPDLRAIYLKLAKAEERHAAFWEEQLRTAGERVPERAPSSRARFLGWLGKTFTIKLIVGVMASMEASGQTRYDAQPEAEGTILSADERSHARLLKELTGPATERLGGLHGRLEGRHRALGGNALRAAVLGANDGLVSNLSLVMGVAGATNSRSAILIAGFAGLLAGSISMALGEWISVKSSRELYEQKLAGERAELRAFPEEERAELALIYRAKGIPDDLAEELASTIIRNEELALDTMAREELGIDPDELGGSAWEAAFASFMLFATGALIPVLPFLFTEETTGIWMSVFVSAIGLFVIGAGISLITGRGLWFSGLRQMAFGLTAAAITYGIGTALGVTIG
ncbi:MAG TPA: VIT1/CCC1 transporter family protein [Acidimicrobiia bacterium]